MTLRATIDAAVTGEQLAGIRPLVVAHVAYEKSLATVSDDWEDRMASQVKAGRIAVFVARLEREAVGYASLTTDVATWTGDAFAHLDCIFIAEAHRGEGVGQLLMEAVAADARSRGRRELQWQTPEWNAGAIRFYERLGATHQTKERFSLSLTKRGSGV